jgi:hypothetical protein
LCDGADYRGIIFLPRDLLFRFLYRYTKRIGKGLAVATTTHQKHDFSFSPAAVSVESPPYSIAAFVVNSEPQTGARSSDRGL